jgi:hypothetical protein
MQRPVYALQAIAGTQKPGKSTPSWHYANEPQ